jgi:hypothetical protein
MREKNDTYRGEYIIYNVIYIIYILYINNIYIIYIYNMWIPSMAFLTSFFYLPHFIAQADPILVILLFQLL